MISNFEQFDYFKYFTYWFPYLWNCPFISQCNNIMIKLRKTNIIILDDTFNRIEF